MFFVSLSAAFSTQSWCHDQFIYLETFSLVDTVWVDSSFHNIMPSLDGLLELKKMWKQKTLLIQRCPVTQTGNKLVLLLMNEELVLGWQLFLVHLPSFASTRRVPLPVVWGWPLILSESPFSMLLTNLLIKDTK